MQIALGGDRPQSCPDGWVAPTATLVGRVFLGAQVSIWYGAVLRAEFEDIRVGARSNIQDGCALHVDMGRPLTLGVGVSVGHNAVLHGCTIEDDVLIGMGAVVLNGARIGTGSIVAAGALITEDFDVPPGSLVAGVPGRVRRELAAAEHERVRRNAEMYLDLARQHAAGQQVG